MPCSPDAVSASVTVRANSVAIVGWHEGGAGLVHSWLEEAAGLHVACFVHADDRPLELDAAAIRRSRTSRFFEVPERTTYKGCPLIAAANWPEVVKRLGIGRALVMLPDNRARTAHIEMARRAGLELINAIHPTAVMLPEAVLHDNVVLHACAVVGYRAELHPGVILNTGAQIDHHGVLLPGAVFDPGATAAGNVTVEACAQIHTGAVIVNRIRIGEDAVVGAGAVVIRDVPAGSTVVGNPARAIRRSP